MDQDPNRALEPPPPPVRYADHPLRSFVLGEIHARPFPVMTTPRVVFHCAFMTDAASAARSREQLLRHCGALGLPTPGADANHHVVVIGPARLQWETHSEFTTYTWDVRADLKDPPQTLAAVMGEDFVPPGPLMVATRLDLVEDKRSTAEILASLDPGSTAVSSLRDGRAIGATDFRVDESGKTRIFVIDRGLLKQEIGPLIQRLVELETYRTLALLGLPEARRLQPGIVRIEKALQEITVKIGQSTGLVANRALLDELTMLAAELEMADAGSAFRFGATKAYSEIVRLRVDAIREGTVEGYSRWSSFLQRRMAPAMRTCQSVESRQTDLARRLGRTTNLLRTRIDVELEQQNRELLASLNQRGRLQLRLQQWVEGLSVAAVSYYVVGLVGYLVKGLEPLGVEADPTLVTALSVPPAVLLIWLFIRRIRARSHAEAEAEDGH